MFQIKPLGDCGLHMQFGHTISEETNAIIRAMSALLETEKISGVVEWVSTYTSLSLYYDPYTLTYSELCNIMHQLCQRLAHAEQPPALIIDIPTCYGGDMGPDLPAVAQHNSLDEQTVIDIHAGTLYFVYMIGFTPGFPYLGGMSRDIATPRLANPRTDVPAGSVGIAGEQTGIYSLASPGGWRIVGRTPLKLFDAGRTPPMLLKAGNYLRFIPISTSEFADIAHAVSEGSYRPRIEAWHHSRGG
ncbi:5-oxoprolinase subunit PxpB [Numidum massiliense]|uniref:5-oxoprolinase subunit PxpB n=1 Tax=Numidum massiliense TaxID=1522315 RepID=UPI0006D530DD|nr:5-oxoprolinase subunit PxpB [Numidum massiliense]